MRTRTSIAACLLVTAFSAQEWKTVPKSELLLAIDAGSRKYEGLQRYEVQSELLAYNNAADVEPTERGTSTVWHMGKSTKAVHLGYTTYQDEHMTVTVDPEEKLIVVAEPVDFFAPWGTEYREQVFSSALSIGKRQTTDGTIFRARFAQGGEFDVLEFFFDGAGWLRRVSTFWAHSIPLVPDNPLSARITPKVVLELGVPKPLAPNSVNTSPSEVLVQSSGGIIPGKNYRGYTIIDNRLRP